MKTKLPFTYGEKTLELSFPDGFLAGDLIRPNPPGEILTRAGMAEKIDRHSLAPRVLVKKETDDLVLS